MAGVPPVALLLYLAMKNGYVTFGIGGLQQRRDHDSKEWIIEESIVPIKSGSVQFEVETDVKWCPSTGEIFYRKPKDTGFFEKEWEEVTEYTDLYKKLLANFQRKYQSPQRRGNPNNRTKWTTAS